MPFGKIKIKGANQMSKFTCKNAECIEAHEEDGEDIRLILIVEEGTKTEYHMNDDGSLELYDSDGTGQEITIQCNVCGQEYELDEPYGYYEIKESYSLPFDKDELKEMKLLKKE